MEARKSGTPCFLCRSLLLNTIVLNNTCYFTCMTFTVDGVKNATMLLL